MNNDFLISPTLPSIHIKKQETKIKNIQICLAFLDLSHITNLLFDEDRKLNKYLSKQLCLQ